MTLTIDHGCASVTWYRREKQVRLKHHINHLSKLLGNTIGDCRFDFHVISAAPQEVIESAL